MWQAPNQRVGAIQNAKKRQQLRMNRPIHLRRIQVAVRLIPNSETHAQATTQGAEGESIDARVLLNDLSTTGIGIYAAHRLSQGQSIQITIDQPRKIQISGEVVWCQEQSSSASVLSNHAFPFRAGIRFHFANPEEETAFKAFCGEIQEQQLYRAR